MFLGRLAAIAALLFAVALPVKVPCGAPDKSCMPVRDAQDRLALSYDLEPLSVMLVENLFDIDLPIRYYTGADVVILD
jgi:hypothetical protein